MYVEFLCSCFVAVCCSLSLFSHSDGIVMQHTDTLVHSDCCTLVISVAVSLLRSNALVLPVRRHRIILLCVHFLCHLTK